ncbi:MAG: c-type cytochrome [Streptosporangiales bacterium]|nr:c-type cytochrome [Streptosporangiales bacterium]
MKWITVRRRHPRAGYAVMLLALFGLGAGYMALMPDSTGGAEAVSSRVPLQDIREGKQLYSQSCSTCHGQNGEGTDVAPSLIGVGAAAVDLQVSTGRMPAMNPDAPQQPRKRRVFNQEETEQIAAYVQSLGGGPPIPSGSDIAYEGADVALGGNLFRANCAQCHNFAGSGGALTGGKEAPDLHDATPTQIYEAMITGPGAMPVFGGDTLSAEEKLAVIKFIVDVREEPNPGGFGLGRFGPVTEGLAGWLIGIGLLIAAALWMTAKKQHD